MFNRQGGSNLDPRDFANYRASNGTDTSNPAEASTVYSGIERKSLFLSGHYDITGAPGAAVFTARVDLPVRAYPDSTKRVQFVAELSRRLEAEPDVRTVTLATAK